MKKMLCIILSVVLIFGCVTIGMFNAFAATPEDGSEVLPAATQTYYSVTRVVSQNDSEFVKTKYDDNERSIISYSFNKLFFDEVAVRTFHTTKEHYAKLYCKETKKNKVSSNASGTNYTDMIEMVVNDSGTYTFYNYIV